ncbi:MAG: hypothetical protein ABII82_19450 [Verrucomicrobiota bacterium]
MDTPDEIMVLNSRPPGSFRFLFIIVGLCFIAVGLFLDGLIIVPFGLLSLLGGGLATRVTAMRDSRQLIQRNSVWGVPYLSNTYDIRSQSVLIGLVSPAGQFGGDGITIVDSYSLHLETPPRSRTMLVWGYSSRRVIDEGRVLAQALGIGFREETE